jgi:hypothetical protein
MRGSASSAIGCQPAASASIFIAVMSPVRTQADLNRSSISRSAGTACAVAAAIARKASNMLIGPRSGPRPGPAGERLPGVGHGDRDRHHFVFPTTS